MYRVSTPSGESLVFGAGNGGWNDFTDAACRVLGITPEQLAKQLDVMIDPLEPGVLPNRAAEAGLVLFEPIEEGLSDRDDC